MESAGMIIISAMLIIFLNTLIGGIRRKRRGLDVSGTIPVCAPVYVAGKAASFILWISALFSGVSLAVSHDTPVSGLFSVSGWLVWVCAALIVIGAILAVVTFRSMGDALKFGLPDAENPPLLVGGIYRWSRNPMYLAFDLIDLAAFLLMPQLLVGVCLIIATGVHHMIILSEERYLLKEYEESYEVYMHEVRRYL